MDSEQWQGGGGEHNSFLDRHMLLPSLFSSVNTHIFHSSSLTRLRKGILVLKGLLLLCLFDHDSTTIYLCLSPCCSSSLSQRFRRTARYLLDCGFNKLLLSVSKDLGSICCGPFQLPENIRAQVINTSPSRCRKFSLCSVSTKVLSFLKILPTGGCKCQC